MYLNAIGGAAQYYARTVQRGSGCEFAGFRGSRKPCGICGWRGFPAIVTMDAHGNSLHAEVEKATAAELEQLQPA